MPFVPCQLAITFLGQSFFFLKLTLEVQGQGHRLGQSSKSQSGSEFLLTHIPFVPFNQPSHSWDTAFSKFFPEIQKNWPWKSEVKVTDEVKAQSHKVGPNPYWLTSLTFHSISHPIPGIQLFKNLSPKIQGQGHRSNSHSGSNILLTHIPFMPCQSAIPFLWYSYFKIWPGKSKVKFMGGGHIISKFCSEWMSGQLSAGTSQFF